MKRATVVVSFLVHAGVATALMTAATKGERRKAISVAVAGAKKKVEPPKPPPPPPPPVHHAPRVVATAPKPAAVTEAPKPMARAPVATALAMSNDDAPGGIALGPGGGAKTGPAAAAAPTRVASVASSRTRRAREGLGDAPAGGPASGEGGDVPCTEEPSKPVPLSKTELEYTAAARTEGIEGKIKLKLVVAADGSVSEVEILASVEPALDQVAVAAVRQWRFKPAMACGKPIAGGTFILQKRYELTD